MIFVVYEDGNVNERDDHRHSRGLVDETFKKVPNPRNIDILLHYSSSSSLQWQCHTQQAPQTQNATLYIKMIIIVFIVIIIVRFFALLHIKSLKSYHHHHSYQFFDEGVRWRQEAKKMIRVSFARIWWKLLLIIKHDGTNKDIWAIFNNAFHRNSFAVE